MPLKIDLLLLALQYVPETSQMVLLFDNVPKNVNLFGAFDSEIHWFQLFQNAYIVSNKLPVNLLQTFQTTFLIQPQVP